MSQQQKPAVTCSTGFSKTIPKLICFFYVSTLGRYSFHAIFCSHMSFMQVCAQWQAVVAPKCNCWMWIWIEMWPRHIVPWVKPQVLCASCSRLEMLEAYPSFCPKVSYILGPILGVPKWWQTSACFTHPRFAHEIGHHLMGLDDSVRVGTRNFLLALLVEGITALITDILTPDQRQL